MLAKAPLPLTFTFPSMPVIMGFMKFMPVFIMWLLFIMWLVFIMLFMGFIIPFDQLLELWLLELEELWPDDIIPGIPVFQELELWLLELEELWPDDIIPGHIRRRATSSLAALPSTAEMIIRS